MIQIQQTKVPTANITVNRNRVKTYGSKIYLKDGSNYEIELWNPTNTKILASIRIDGKTISEKGIIIKPGERIYLERWIDTPRKFKFSTYEVEDTHEAKEAIKYNGEIVVSFYNESLKLFYPSGYTTITTGKEWQPPYYYTQDIVGIPNIYCSSSNTLFSSNTESGMSEKGEKSSQDLIPSEGDFDTWASWSSTWKILPESHKPLETKKIRSYCTECGTRVRAASWKFCPSCGSKL